jgi:hypothetical protein
MTRQRAPHNDHLNEIRKGFSIALVSLGDANPNELTVASGQIAALRQSANQPLSFSEVEHWIANCHLWSFTPAVVMSLWDVL